MKKLILTLGGAIVAGVLVVAGINALDNHYQSNAPAPAAPTVNKFQAQAAIVRVQTADTAKYQTLTKKYNSAVAECKKGAVAYAKLTYYQKTQTVLPSCPTPIGQQ